MTRPAIVICLLCLATLRSFAQGSAPSATPACDEGVARACRAAVDELAVARKLIEALTAETVAAKGSLDAKSAQLKLLADQNQALIEQNMALKESLAARADQIKALEELIGKFQIRIADLEKKNARGRRFAVGAFVGGLVLGAVAAGR